MHLSQPYSALRQGRHFGSQQQHRLGTPRRSHACAARRDKRRVAGTACARSRCSRASDKRPRPARASDLRTHRQSQRGLPHRSRPGRPHRVWHCSSVPGQAVPATPPRNGAQLRPASTMNRI
ncbi:hypothetical protein FA09DRAFT_132576 [Tilletiopsis washingtonensis]|uniref:Uncharacterized protein n=1 Tax=Tilletiopsis washingtonensis TaxID=58919 RepID=A0A316Z3R6_9BASI|nr:hypothetical protein FA09DRAFT_132576 [Tilletiopsis washingtonensis]PWN95552.1 hypothetical protein FA09DRAFT_132576 [Tilletiopsis washingtonensis]